MRESKKSEGGAFKAPPPGSYRVKKMINYGVSSKMLKMIENMYSKMKTRVRSTEGYTNSFLLENGLMQGECLSPSLFSMYVNDIVEHIESVESMGVLLGNTKITVLKYADDLVLFAKSAKSLQLGLNALHQFCEINKLAVNCDKSKVMHFTANKSVTVKDLQYDGTKLEWVNNFKYLGVTFNKSNSFTDGIEELCQHAQRAQTVLDLHFLKHKTVPVSYEIEVFNTLVKPILLYGSEVYGINCVKSLETFYLKFLKRALCVKRSTNTCMVLAETRQYPLAVDIQLNMVKLWIKILTCDKDQLIWIAYDSMLKSKVHLSNSKCWTRKIQELLFRVGFGYIWENQMVPDVKKFLNMLKQRLQDIHIQECYSSIENNSRCMLYKHLKPVYSMENYLKCNYHRDFRQYLTKLRLSSHKFLVERGRWVKPKINYHERLCTLCDENDIEDEYHILMKCKYFVNLREKYISKKYYKRPSMYKFQKLMNTTKRELYRLILFIKFIFKEYNSHLTEV